jgi:uncharacterized protein (DUF488 family)
MLSAAHMHPFYTIGNSTRSIGEFVDLLRSVEVTLVIDARTVPRSRTNPQYNRESLLDTLRQFEVSYEHIASLGGLRGTSPDVSSSVNAFWQNRSFHNYADYALGSAFHERLARVTQLGREGRCAIMCAEAVWWRCHRRIITDYLLAAGETVSHNRPREDYVGAVDSSCARLLGRFDLSRCSVTRRGPTACMVLAATRLKCSLRGEFRRPREQSP